MPALPPLLEQYLTLSFKTLNKALSLVMERNEIEMEPLCNKLEAETQLCYNGGECQVNVIKDVRELLCKCPTGYGGKECENIVIDYGWFASTQLEEREIIIIIAISVFFIVVALFITIFAIRKYRRYRAAKAALPTVATNGNGTHNRAIKDHGYESVVDMSNGEQSTVTSRLTGD